MPDLTSLLSLQARSRRNARDQMLLMRAERDEAVVAQAHLSGAVARAATPPGAKRRPDRSGS